MTTTMNECEQRQLQKILDRLRDTEVRLTSTKDEIEAVTDRLAGAAQRFTDEFMQMAALVLARMRDPQWIERAVAQAEEQQWEALCLQVAETERHLRSD